MLNANFYHDHYKNLCHYRLMVLSGFTGQQINLLKWKKKTLELSGLLFIALSLRRILKPERASTAKIKFKNHCYIQKLLFHNAVISAYKKLRQKQHSKLIRSDHKLASFFLQRSPGSFWKICTARRNTK